MQDLRRVRLLNVGEALPINERLAGLVPMAMEDEQEALTRDIEANGLREPVVLWRGEIVDGRCRQKACLVLGRQIMAKELDDELTEEDVRVFVKSVNTRRNLTSTQKLISACKESLRPGGPTISAVAKAWGVGEALLNNARYIARNRPGFIEPLFNGKSVSIVDIHGREVLSNKISAIYAYLQRQSRSVEEVVEYGYAENAYIKTQAGKDWYYSQLANMNDVSVRMALAELANFKFTD